MDTTPLTLLQRLKGPQSAAAWDRFVSLYSPLLFAWCKRLGLKDEPAADLVQDVLLILVRRLPTFEHDGVHRFRGWLRTVLVNCWRGRRQRTAEVSLDATHEPAVEASTAAFIEQEYLQLLTQRAVQVMQSDFEPTSWQAFWKMVVEGKPAQTVADELALSVGAVYVAKSRVLRRLREELTGLLE